MRGRAIHQFDIGTSFTHVIEDDEIPGVAVDISAQTTIEFLFQRPDGTVLTVTPVFTTDGTDGSLTYVTVSGDLSLVGTWRLQARVILPASEFHPELTTFKVREIIPV